jgi:hypothetical protein
VQPIVPDSIPTPGCRNDERKQGKKIDAIANRSVTHPFSSSKVLGAADVV